MLNHFRLIGWKTINFFFLIIDFRSLNFGMIDFLSAFFFNFFLIFFFFYQWICQVATCNIAEAKRKISLSFFYLLLIVSLDQFFETDWSINNHFFDLFHPINRIFWFFKIIDHRLESNKKLSMIGITVCRIICLDWNL